MDAAPCSAERGSAIISDAQLTAHELAIANQRALIKKRGEEEPRRQSDAFAVGRWVTVHGLQKTTLNERMV